MRLLAYWERQRGDRSFPALADIDSATIGDMWPWCLILDTVNGRDFPCFSYLGPMLARYSGIFLSGKTDWTHTLLDKSVQRFRETLEHRAPVLIEDELALYDGRRLLFRSILLPLSDDGQVIDHVLGAANGKLVDGTVD
ncbi:MAG: PAS domain-containing protein [Alphaproteobacteria bacterium]